MSIVIDASITLSWYFEDEVSGESEAVFDHVVANGAVTPVHWKLEIANGFRTALRKGRTDDAYRKASLNDLDAMAIEIDRDTIAHAWSEVVRLSDLYRLTPYDAAYLELALRRNLPLATLDRALQRAAIQAGVQDAQI